jgi:hypothetical protein
MGIRGATMLSVSTSLATLTINANGEVAVEFVHAIPDSRS